MKIMAMETLKFLFNTRFLCLLLPAAFCSARAQEAPAVQKGDPCGSKEELSGAAGKYYTAAQYPWPGVRAAYFEKMTTAADKATARQTLEQIEKLEQQSRNNFTLRGGTWEALYSTEGYLYTSGKRLADYRFQAAFHEYLCINRKTDRNGEYSTVMRVYVNTLPLNTLSRYLTNAFSDNLQEYAYQDWKNVKPGTEAPKISLMGYLIERSAGLVDALNSGKGYWQDTPESAIRKDTYDHIYRYWLIQKAGIPVLIPVNRKAYLESLLEYYEREKLLLTKATKSTPPERVQKMYGNDWMAILEEKKATVNRVLQENTADWLAQQAVVNPDEDLYQNQKQNLPEYSSSFTFRKFYDGEKKSWPLFRYNPAYFQGQNAASPQFITLVFRFVSRPVHLRLVTNFTDNFDRSTWEKLLR